ncbi:SRPBCC family protein [Micromonospora sp. WMMD1076]|uniref:SRPBCC family protein n=1 Tax=Micromonospora TaxID=1873 RepID=UPI00249A7CCB|nr:SRPBCC family protein [Micromonospora sp. WMMD1076]WFF04698.1 SRPBCC family protein [Micromonospora sp. WMMD1076]
MRRVIRESRVVAATPGEVFDLLADPAKHPLIDGSGSVLAARGTPRRLALGMKFGMDMHMGVDYSILNTVVEFEEDRLIAWRHFNGHRWRWRLEPTAEGRTRVTEEFDWSTARTPLLISISWFPRRNRRAMRSTLDRLEAHLAARGAGERTTDG